MIDTAITDKLEELVCVILPTYNNERTIIRAIDSVMNQDYEGNFLLLVVPNGCTDKTPELVDKYIVEYNNKNLYNFLEENGKYQSNKRMFSMSCEGVKGVTQAFNFGLEQAQIKIWEMYKNKNIGEILVCRMDGDDAWYPNKISTQVEFFKNNPEIDVLGAQMRFVDPQTFEPLDGTFAYPQDHDTIMSNMFRGSNPIANPVAMWKWSVMDKAGRFEELFPYAEDYWFYCKAAITGHTFANLPNVLMDYSFEIKPHSNPNVGISVANVAGFILQNKLNQTQ